MNNVEEQLHDAMVEAVVAMSKANVFRRILRDRGLKEDDGGCHFKRPGEGWNPGEPGVLTDMVFDRTMETLDSQMKASFDLVVNMSASGGKDGES